MSYGRMFQRQNFARFAIPSLWDVSELEQTHCRFCKLTVADCPRKIQAGRDKAAAQVTYSELPIS